MAELPQWFTWETTGINGKPYGVVYYTKDDHRQSVERKINMKACHKINDSQANFIAENVGRVIDYLAFWYPAPEQKD